ncbi:MAG: RagB/SusD family nutrient uptake outer membrane protein [Bacteroidetes bacterium]|nr:MAG: RagB/SusD family nutrient uptake outer membrane protein [Bacteroidota bacterium]
MKKQLIKILYGMVSLLFLFTTSCTKDYTSTSSVPISVAFSSPQAMAEIAVGLQRTYTLGRGSSLYNRVTINGLLTSELVVLNQGNTGEYQLQLGAGNVDGTNTLAAGLWTTSNKIIFDADNLISGAASLGDKAYASGIIAYADLFKALALGDLAMFWEKVPTSTGKNVSFADRSDGFTKAIAALDEALTAVTANPVSATFLYNIPAGIDIVNSLHALKARYLIFTGKNAEALAEANIPSLTIKSVFNFTTATLNPIYETGTSTNNVTAVSSVTTLGLPAGLQPSPADQRLPFYTTTAYASQIKGFAAAPTTPWPVYLPGEMTLIRAEAYARQNDLVNGLAELNKVVTKQPATDAYGVGAGLPPVVGLTQAQLLDEIYKQRCIELFMSGFKLEDMRRFGRPNSEKKRNFLPYPFLERDNNSNTPPDPAF